MKTSKNLTEIAIFNPYRRNIGHGYAKKCSGLGLNSLQSTLGDKGSITLGGRKSYEVEITAVERVGE